MPLFLAAIAHVGRTAIPIRPSPSRPPLVSAPHKPLAPSPSQRYSFRMADSQTTALERLLRPLSQSFSIELARALAGVQADAETQARYDELAGKHTDGQLTPAELAELASIVRANTLLGVLKAEARAFLVHAKPS